MFQGFLTGGRRAGVMFAALFILSILCATALMGQTYLGSFVGLVTDTTGGVVPEAKVVLTDTLTGVQRTTVTNSTGNYTLDNVPTGTYKVAVTKTGFEQVVSSDIILGTAVTVRFDAVLQVGQVSQKVEVTAQAPALNTENAQLGSVVTRSEISDLPMEKSPMNFRYLDSANQDGGYLGGQRASIGTYSVDGVSAMAPAWGAWSGPMMSMSLDSIQDVTEVTSTPSAEFGDVANISVSTRSGTNVFHGSAFWDTNNNALDADDYFAHTKGHGPYRQFFGGAIGGPLTIPHLYNGKNRTFFFFEWEDFRQPGGYVTQVSVPDAAFRAGNFSSLLALQDGNGNPAPQIIYDPTTYNAATGTFSAFPGNIIPSNRINAVSAKIQSTQYLPLPNFNPGGSIDWQNNFVGRFPNAYPDFYPTVRIDHSLRNGKDMITGRWQYRHQNEDGNSVGLPGYNYVQNRNTTNVYVSETHSFSPSLVNEARIGFSRDFSAYYNTTYGTPVVQDWGLQVPGASGLTGVHGFPGVTWSNFVGGANGGLIGTANNGWAQNTQQFLDNVTYSHGKHVIKVGFDFRRFFIDEPSGSQNNFFGLTSFSEFGTQSMVPGVAGSNPTGGFDYASFLLGDPGYSGITTKGPNVIDHYGSYAAYVQEDWRVTSKLTVNAGLRWDHTPGPTDQNNMRYAFNPANGDLVVPSANSLRLVSPGWPSAFPIETVAQAGWSTGRSLVSTSQDFGPRLGFAYRLPSKMVIRGGAGIFYTPLIHSAMINSYAGGPFTVAQQFTNVMTAPTPGGANANFLFGFPNPYSEAGNPAAYSVPAAGGLLVSTNEPYLRTPLTQQYNFTVEKQFGDNTVARVSYRGHHMIELIYYPNLNQPTICSVAAGNCNRTYEYTPKSFPNYYEVQYGVNGGSEFGNQFELELQKRYGKGFTFNLSYTHTLLEEDVRTGDWTGASDIVNYPTYSWNREYDRGTDVGLARNRFVGSGIWILPVGKGQRFGSDLPKVLQEIVGGWQTSYILTTRSGYYNDIDCSGCTDYGFAQENDTRLTLNQVFNSRIGNPTASRWFNSSAYVPNLVLGKEGNAPPGSIVGPGLVNLDFALIKSFPIRENMRMKFRASAMNALNHPNLGGPNTDISSPTVGTITYLDNTGGLGSDSSNSGMRQIMLEMRFEF
ncbi:MAG: carboxypeptidase regulatory-like domain-containing protein [Terriglobia bacterium]